LSGLRFAKIFEKIQIKTKRNFYDSINSMIAKKHLIYGKKQKNDEKEWKMKKTNKLC